tara:strand:+ start:217 stop:462 length:246 start_codon:yes stop_codon:yes gene_type:complete
MILISDSPSHTSSLQGMLRWCDLTMSCAENQILSCLDSIQPDQILIVKSQSSLTDDNWITSLKRHAIARNIVYSNITGQAP